MASNFSIVVDTALSQNSVSNLQQKLNRHKYQINVDANNDSIKKFADKLNANIEATLKHSKNFKNFTTEVTQDFNKMHESIQNALVLDTTKNGTKHFVEGYKYLTQYKNALGDVIERTVEFTEKNKMVDISEKKIVSGISQVTTEITKSKEAYNGFHATLQKTTKSFEDTDGNIKKVITENRQWTDSNGKLNTEIKTLDENGNRLSATIRQISESEKETATQSGKLSQSFSDVVEKVAKFYVASLPIRMVQQSITDAIQTVKDFDRAFTEFAKVTNLAGEELNSYIEKLGDLGTAVGRTKTTMTELATGFRKAGYSEEDSAKLATYGALLQNTADEQLEASEATSVIVSALKAFDLQATDTIRILDDINITSQDFAVSSADISRGLTQAGASMSTYGNSLEQTISLLTAGTEIFQGKSQQVARALNTIASRVAKNEEALADYGIAVKDQEGNLRATYDILQDLAKQWDNISNSEKVSLGTTLAGYWLARQYADLINEEDGVVSITILKINMVA